MDNAQLKICGRERRIETRGVRQQRLNLLRGVRRTAPDFPKCQSVIVIGLGVRGLLLLKALQLLQNLGSGRGFSLLHLPQEKIWTRIAGIEVGCRADLEYGLIVGSARKLGCPKSNQHSNRTREQPVPLREDFRGWLDSV